VKRVVRVFVAISQIYPFAQNALSMPMRGDMTASFMGMIIGKRCLWG